MVAKSFQAFEMLGEPYAVAGKSYINVKNPKTGTVRKVRWYSDAEYRKLYPEDSAVAASNQIQRTQKEIFGFDNGYITIFKCDWHDEYVRNWFHDNGAHYGPHWGWNYKSTETVPENLPDSVTPFRLDWDKVGDVNGDLYANEFVDKAVADLIYNIEDSKSQFIGDVGERIQVDVTVTRTYESEGYYGTSIMYTLEDADGNVYIWNTAAKRWAVGTTHSIKGTVKDHKEYRGTRETILTRCAEVK